MRLIKIVLNYILRASEYDLVKTRGDVLYEAYISCDHRVDDLTAERDYLDARCAELEVEIIKLRVKLSEKEMK